MHAKFEVFRITGRARDPRDGPFPASPTASADAGFARVSGRVVFYADVANVVPGTPPFENVPRVRPGRVELIENGSAILEKLQWSSWGGPVARATGILSASNCVPNCAEGRRTYDTVHLVLSQRRRLFHRTVYSCYQLIDPKARLSDFQACLKPSSGSQYYYSAVAGRH